MIKSPGVTKVFVGECLDYNYIFMKTPEKDFVTFFRDEKHFYNFQFTYAFKYNITDKYIKDICEKIVFYKIKYTETLGEIYV